MVPANLLWAIENQIVTTRGINAHLPPVDEWPAALLDLLPPDAPRNNWRRTLLRVLARMLYPSVRHQAPERLPVSPVIGTDAPEQYERREDIGAPRKRMPSES